MDGWLWVLWLYLYIYIKALCIGLASCSRLEIRKIWLFRVMPRDLASHCEFIAMLYDSSGDSN